MLEKITARPATDGDYSFGYFAKKAAMKRYIEKTWGWNTEVQKEKYRKYFHTQNSFVIEYEKLRIGWLEYEDNNEIIEIHQIFILPKYQHNGIGSMILNNIINTGKRKKIPVRLQVLKSNPEAKKLYTTLGFMDRGLTDTHIIMEKMYDVSTAAVS